MKCPNKNCNADNPQGSKFCNQCGTKLETSKKCPYPDCGTDNLPAMAKFCPDCGRPLEKKAPQKESVVEVKRKVSFKVPSDMIFVEGGTFKMGSETDHSDEKPVHYVTLSDFYIGKYAVSQKLWMDVMYYKNPSHFRGNDLPVENVSWFDCIFFCNALSRRDGFEELYLINGDLVTLLSRKRGYRLPTEAEWEFSARGGNKSKGFTYSGSNNMDQIGWYDNNSGGKTHLVGQKGANELGLFDLSGNVREWCWDCFSTYPSSSQTNPLGSASGLNRVLRGGSWRNSVDSCRLSYRCYGNPSNSNDGLGFRLVFVS